MGIKPYIIVVFYQVSKIFFTVCSYKEVDTWGKHWPLAEKLGLLRPMFSESSFSTCDVGALVTFVCIPTIWTQLKMNETEKYIKWGLSHIDVYKGI